jgi:hypothetical protein
MTDLYPLMLGMMAGGEQAASARSTLLQMVSQQEGMDPTTRALLAHALGPPGHEESPPALPPSAGWSGGDPRRRDAVHRLRGRMDAMRDELEELRERQDRLAAALGACADCWGEDPECEVCGGMGAPGSFVPDPRLYRTLVSPACRAAGAGRERRLVGVIDPPSTHATGGVT